MSANGNPDIVTSGLVLALDAADIKSYPRTGTVWYDRSGLGNNGTLVNSVSAVGGTMVFDGVDDYITRTSTTSLQMDYNISISVWFRIPQNGLPYRQALVGKYYTEYELGIYPTGYVHTYTSNGLSGSGYDEGISAFHPDGDWKANRWYNVVWTLDNAAEKVYYEGKHAASATKANIGTKKSTNNLEIGIRVGGGLQFKGDISQVLIYNKTLTPEEILQNYNATKSRFQL